MRLRRCGKPLCRREHFRPLWRHAGFSVQRSCAIENGGHGVGPSSILDRETVRQPVSSRKLSQRSAALPLHDARRKAGTRPHRWAVRSLSVKRANFPSNRPRRGRDLVDQPTYRRSCGTQPRRAMFRIPPYPSTESSHRRAQNWAVVAVVGSAEALQRPSWMIRIWVWADATRA